MNLVIVHGGAGGENHPVQSEALEKAAMAGYNALAGGHLDAVERAVVAMEDDPLFNAGYGSVLNLAGEVEMDAAVFDGSTVRCGGVVAIRDVRNPVQVARLVMDETPHALLAGEGAIQFARNKGFESFTPVTEKQKVNWEKAILAHQRGEQPDICALTGESGSCDTVGCIAVKNGLVAAASSTGGVLLKLPGRVGDTGVFGAGIYASPQGAVVCTGLGEIFIQRNIAAWTVNLINQGVNVHDAARAAIHRLTGSGATGGVLVADAEGNAAAVYNAALFPVAMVVNGELISSFSPIKI
ncbi:MAG: isoaspartyl peptidase/L-asparaginase [Desulfotomaculaceae bacterium]